MSDETIVAIYDTPAHAELAAADLRQAGVPESAISIHTGTITPAGTRPSAPAAPREQGFWSSLFGGSPDHDTSVYERSVDHGGSVLSVKTPEAHVARVLEIIESHDPIDIDERAETYAASAAANPAPVMAPGASATPVAAAGLPPSQPAPVKPAPVKPTSVMPTTPAVPEPVMSAPRGDTMQLSEESLSVGKRVVNRGGTRIRRFVVERPVEESVSLHSENVVLDRRPVTDGRPAADSFSEKTIEMMETAEEAIVSKVAHVYEEVALRKEEADRVETVRDSVRKEEVEIERIPGTDPATHAGPAPTPRNPVK